MFALHISTSPVVKPECRMDTSQNTKCRAKRIFESQELNPLEVMITGQFPVCRVFSASTSVSAVLGAGRWPVCPFHVVVSICPVTAAVMRAARYSFQRSTEASVFSISSSIVAVLRSRKSAIRPWVARSGSGIRSALSLWRPSSTKVVPCPAASSHDSPD